MENIIYNRTRYLCNLQDSKSQNRKGWKEGFIWNVRKYHSFLWRSWKILWKKYTESFIYEF